MQKERYFLKHAGKKLWKIEKCNLIKIGKKEKNFLLYIFKIPQ